MFRFSISNLATELEVAEMLTTIIQNHSSDDTPWEQLKACGIQNHTPTFSLQNAIAGKVLLHAKRQIDAFREHMGVSLCVFKIGVTSNPAERFLSYSVKHFAAMWVVYSGSDLGMVHMLEAALILHYQEAPGCRNAAHSGGEGGLNRKFHLGPPYFVYVTGGRADQFKRVG